jgi:hypothetical protein
MPSWSGALLSARLECSSCGRCPAAAASWRGGRGCSTCAAAGCAIHVVSHGKTYDTNNPCDRKSLAEDDVDAEYESEQTRGAEPAYAGKRVLRGRVVGDAVWPELLTEAEHHQLVALLTDPARKAITAFRSSPELWLIRCGSGQLAPLRNLGCVPGSVSRSALRSLVQPGCAAAALGDLGAAGLPQAPPSPSSYVCAIEPDPLTEAGAAPG